MNAKDTSKSGTRRKQLTCRCKAYPFPHRAWSIPTCTGPVPGLLGPTLEEQQMDALANKADSENDIAIEEAQAAAANAPKKSWKPL